MNATVTGKPALLDWCVEQLGERGTLHALPGDAGFRRYARLFGEQGRRWIVAQAEPELLDQQPFVDLTIAFAERGLPVPAIIAWAPRWGYLLQQDLGEGLLDRELAPADLPAAEGLAAALALLQQLQQVTPPPGLPAYDGERLQAELDLFPEWFCERLLGLDRGVLAPYWSGLCRALIDSALAQPQVLVHRDYHCRNLIPQADGTLAMVDYQDAVVGPASYDLVSILKDCYRRWPADQVAELARVFAEGFGDRHTVPAEQWLQQFHWMGLQRHLKVLGIFARLHLRDGKARYLDDLPLVLAYTREVLQQEPAFAAFSELFEQVLMPAARQQPWFRELPLALPR